MVIISSEVSGGRKNDWVQVENVQQDQQDHVLRGDQMIDTITGITSYLGVTSAKIFAGVCPYKDDSS